MTRRGWLLVILALVAIAAFGLWLWSLEWKKEVVEGRFTEDAREQPYLVAERFLASWEVSLEKERGFSRLDGNTEGRPMPPANETLLLINAYGQLSERRAQNLLRWIEQGGHALVSAHNPFVGLGSAVQDPLFDHFGVGVEALSGGMGRGLEFEQQCDQLGETAVFSMGDEEELEIAMPSDRVLVLEEDREARTIVDGSGLRLVQMDSGQGMVTFIASPSLWRNAYIGCHDHAFMLWQLAPDQSALRILENLEGPSLWTLVNERARLATWALLAGILLMLWHHGVRFGPLREDHREGRRSLLEHVEAAARFSWRHGTQSRLLGAVQREVESRAATVITGYRSMRPGDRYKALAEHADMEEPLVAEAMTLTRMNENRFLAAIQTLKSLRDKL